MANVATVIAPVTTPTVDRPVLTSAAAASAVLRAGGQKIPGYNAINRHRVDPYR